jgi:hypothetical protein
MVEIKNKVIQYMMDIDLVARKIFVVEGPISLMEFSEELKNAENIGEPFVLQREAHKQCNIQRLRVALQKAMNHFEGQPLTRSVIGIYEFPLKEGKLSCEEQLLQYLDEVF